MSVANSYAKALYSAATEGGDGQPDCDRLEQEMDRFLTLLSAHDGLRVALTGFTASSKEKASIVEEISKSMGLSKLGSQFIKLLVSKRRMSILKPIREAFTQVRLAAEGGISGKLVAADPLSAADIDGLTQAFSKKLGKRVAFQVATDPDLLAGFKVSVNGVTYDGTLRAQLQRLRDRFVSGSLSR